MRKTLALLACIALQFAQPTAHAQSNGPSSSLSLRPLPTKRLRTCAGLSEVECRRADLSNALVQLQAAVSDLKGDSSREDFAIGRRLAAFDWAYEALKIAAHRQSKDAIGRSGVAAASPNKNSVTPSAAGDTCSEDQFPTISLAVCNNDDPNCIRGRIDETLFDSHTWIAKIKGSVCDDMARDIISQTVRGGYAQFQQAMVLKSSSDSRIRALSPANVSPNEFAPVTSGDPRGGAVAVGAPGEDPAATNPDDGGASEDHDIDKDSGGGNKSTKNGSHNNKAKPEGANFERTCRSCGG